MLSEIATSENLRLAWRRITTGSNLQYKRYFRHIYYAYEVSLEDNIKYLRHLLRHRAFTPTTPQRVYLPKTSGLQRPIGLLRVDDQIVLQAIANIFAKKVFSRRENVQNTIVYSNILMNIANPFFFRDWRITFGLFRNKVEDYYRRGYRWMADFDLAAFYDTISHELLLRTAYPRKRFNADTDYILNLFEVWSSPKPTARLHHGLPQGPLASDFLAEVFLLPVDEALQNRYSYVRYVDDVRLFGLSEAEVRHGVLKLEIACRERGLIPQSTKTAIRRATSIIDAVGMLPSLRSGDDGRRLIPPSLAENHMRRAISGKPARITDKTRARYVFFRARPSATILKWALRLLPRHPEHCDAIMAYLSQYDYRRSIERLCLSLLQESPYEVPKGEAFHTLARFLERGKLSATTVRQVLNLALLSAQARSAGFGEKWGALHYLCIAEDKGMGRYSQFCRYQNELLQACLGPILPLSAFSATGVVTRFLQRTAPEPGLSLASKLLQYSLDPSTLVPPNNIPTQAANVFRTLGLSAMRRTRTDALAEILARRYGLSRHIAWRELLSVEYTHALGMLAQADAVFNTGRSEWLQWQNSFNQTLFLSLQIHLRTSGLPGVVRTVDRNGHLIDYGVTLDRSNSFSRHYSIIAGAFREMNTRRNRLPASHPYERRTRHRTEYLTVQERNRFINLLRQAYNEIARII